MSVGPTRAHDRWRNCQPDRRASPSDVPDHQSQAQADKHNGQAFSIKECRPKTLPIFELEIVGLHISSCASKGCGANNPDLLRRLAAQFAQSMNSAVEPIRLEHFNLQQVICVGPRPPFEFLVRLAHFFALVVNNARPYRDRYRADRITVTVQTGRQKMPYPRMLRFLSESAGKADMDGLRLPGAWVRLRTGR